jgi:hypothetical protein
MAIVVHSVMLCILLDKHICSKGCPIRQCNIERYNFLLKLSDFFAKTKLSRNRSMVFCTPCFLSELGKSEGITCFVGLHTKETPKCLNSCTCTYAFRNDMKKSLTCVRPLSHCPCVLTLAHLPMNSVRIWVRIDLPPCNIRGGTIKIPPCSKAQNAEHRPKFCSPTPAMVTSPYK